MCIISYYMEEQNKFNENKNMQKEYMLNAIKNINDKYKKIKVIGEENGFCFIEFMNDISSDKVDLTISLLDYEANIRGIYLSKEQSIMKVRLSIAADIGSINGFMEKLEEILSKL